MKREYRAKNFTKSSLAIIDKANAIIEQYAAGGYDLTLRQLYYQFVARDIIANKQTEYKRLGSIINDARLAAHIDWNAIVDRTRNYQAFRHFDDPAHRLRSAAASYLLDIRADQDEYVEVWVEKDALIGVIESACDPLDVGYFSCRGYVSQSEMWAAAQRLAVKSYHQECFIIHLGDHDPSGIQMTEDIQQRLNMFEADTTVERIALNMDQIEEYGPPPNPAKTTDSRYAAYRTEYGDESWELDALEPQVLSELIGEAVARHTNQDRVDAMVEQQEADRAKIQKIADEWGE